MTGEEDPAPSLLTGARDVRRVLTEHGMSSEFSPSQVLHRAEGLNPTSEQCLDDLSGTWNLQADAALSHLMDFSDYYVIPESPLSDFWRMSEQALKNAYTLERLPVIEKVLSSPEACRRIFGTEDLVEAREEYKRRIVALSGNEKIREAAVGTEWNEETGINVIKPAKPKYCQCWFMELDDSPFSQWAMNNGEGTSGQDILLKIDNEIPPRVK